MKYTITESRLHNIIQNYITSIVGTELVKHSTIQGVPILTLWWTNPNGNIVFQADNSEDDWALGVREDIWQSINDMFALGAIETDTEFMTWMKNYSGMEFPSGVFTFEDDDVSHYDFLT